MSDGWQTEPHKLDPDVALAADRLNDKLPHKFPKICALGIESYAGGPPVLSDSTDRVLRASEVIPDTFEALVARLSSHERRELFKEMRP